MSEKARLFGDKTVRQQIMSCRDQGAIKKLGRKVKHFDEKTWERERPGIAICCLLAKFQQNSALGKSLLSTGDALLVEAAPNDAVWGIGMSESKAQWFQDRSHWAREGTNLLGRTLVAVRAQLRAAIPAPALGPAPAAAAAGSI